MPRLLVAFALLAALILLGVGARTAVAAEPAGVEETLDLEPFVTTAAVAVPAATTTRHQPPARASDRPPEAPAANPPYRPPRST